MSAVSTRSTKRRLDQCVVELGWAPTRARAAALILSGAVTVNNVVITKAGTMVPVEALVALRRPDHPYVGRGGVKLAHAIAHFGIDVRGRICLDAGASTGGFTDCLLQHGAARIYALDVGRGQLAWRLQNDPRIIMRDQTNLRTLDVGTMPERVSLVTLDLSFISLRLIFPVVSRLLAVGGEVVALIKPQFEVGRETVGKGGIVRDAAARAAAVHAVEQAALDLAWTHVGTIESPLQGSDGNVEYLAYFQVA